MALVKCKECGEEISKKADSCPKCGAKKPKKTSLFTWIATLFIVYIIYAAAQNTGSVNSASTPKAEPQKKTATVKPSWTISTSKDQMTGKASAYAHSPATRPNKIMSFPYNNVESWMGVGCNSESEWAYFGFNSAPNLTNDETKDGYSLIKTRINWDDKTENVSLTQKWSADFIHFKNSSAAISNIAASNSVMLELHWHGEQPSHFKYLLRGSSKALAEIRSKCAKM